MPEPGRTEGENNLEPEYKIDGHLMKIIYPRGHFYHAEGHEMSFYCESEDKAKSPEALELLVNTNQGLELFWKTMDEVDKLSREWGTPPRNLTEEESNKINTLKNQAREAMFVPANLMNKSGNISVAGANGGYVVSNRIDTHDFVNAYSHNIAYSGLKSSSGGTIYHLYLDQNLKFDYDQTRGVRYHV